MTDKQNNKQSLREQYEKETGKGANDEGKFHQSFNDDYVKWLEKRLKKD